MFHIVYKVVSFTSQASQVFWIPACEISGYIVRPRFVLFQASYSPPRHSASMPTPGMERSQEGIFSFNSKGGKRTGDADLDGSFTVTHKAVPGRVKPQGLITGCLHKPAIRTMDDIHVFRRPLSAIREETRARAWSFGSSPRQGKGNLARDAKKEGQGSSNPSSQGIRKNRGSSVSLACAAQLR